MANFNLPFGVRISNDSVLDASRYVVDSIVARDFIITDGRAYSGMQTYVNDVSTLYILKDVSNSIWSIIPDLSTIAISDASKLNNYTDTFYGDLTIDGSILISGNIIQDGSYYVTNVEEITSKNEFITLREGSITALNDGSISGIRILKADGSANVILGASNDAVMRVGWEEEDLLAIATREDNPTNLGYAYWDDASSMFKTDVLAETANRTIYVETTGNDETGDGLTVGTAFATIGKAISTIKKFIDTNIAITIKLGQGTFIISQDIADKISKITGDGTLNIEGTIVLADSGFTMGSAELNDPLTYAVSGGNSGSWTTDQWKYYFLKSGTNYYPLTHNTTTSISCVRAVTGNEIYQAVSTIELPSNMIFNIKFNISYCELSISSTTTFKYEIYRFQLSAGYLDKCIITSTSTLSIYFHGNISVYRSSFDNVRLIISSIYTFSNNYINVNTNNACFSYSGRTEYPPNFVYNTYENANTGSSSCAILIGNTLNSENLGAIVYSKFVNTYVAFRYASNDIPSTVYEKFIFKNCSYAFRRYDANTPQRLIRLKFNYSMFYGTPLIKWFYHNMYEFINLNSGRSIEITGLIYPEFEQNLSSNLTNNTTTHIIIGDVSQNISCKVDYTIKRGTGFRSGNFNIISDVSNSYITPDIFGTNFDSNVDASAISFSTDISNGKYIMMNVTQNNSTDASLFYNVSRVMRTPISI